VSRKKYIPVIQPSPLVAGIKTVDDIVGGKSTNSNYITFNGIYEVRFQASRALDDPEVML